jgi:hypothetical protein
VRLTPGPFRALKGAVNPAPPIARRLERATILSMAIEQILALLIAERNKLDQALAALQGPTHRRGRLPRNVSASAPAPSRKGRRTFTPAQRKQQADRMRAFWAAKRAAEAKSQSKTGKRSKKPAKVA